MSLQLTFGGGEVMLVRDTGTPNAVQGFVSEETVVSRNVTALPTNFLFQKYEYVQFSFTDILGTKFWIKVSGVWKEAIPWIKVSGVWKEAIAWIKVAGTWRPQNNFTLFPGAEVGFSLRKLRSDYTGSAVRVRRVSDNAEQDIGFVNDVLDEAAIMTFCGTSEGRVTTWYDQMSGKNFVQTVAALQPHIKFDSATDIIKINGKPGIEFGFGGTDVTDTTFLEIASGQTLNFVEGNYLTFVGEPLEGAYKVLSGPNYGLSIDSAGYDMFFTFLEDGTPPASRKVSVVKEDFLTSQEFNNHSIYTALNNDTVFPGSKIFFNSVEVVGLNITATSSNQTNRSITHIGGHYGGNLNHSILQEIVYYNANQETNRVSIESNMNAFYNVY